MLGINEYIPIYVQTHRGILAIDDLVYNDIIYEYGTGNELKVIDVTGPDPDVIYDVKYSDDRSQIYRAHDHVFTGNSVVEVNHIFGKDKFPEIPLKPIELYRSKISRPLHPDPCIAGALIIFGRYDTPYINLPLDRNGVNQLFAHKYNLDYADKLEDNTTFYAYNGADKSKPITWKEFFPYYDFYATSGMKYSPLIPDEYTRASINDRWKFIRGVFDVGYDPVMFPDNVGIASDSEDRLKEVQKMLWSLGVPSKVSFDPHLPLARGRTYQLDVIGRYDGYPGFFYDINNIRKTIRNDNVIKRPISDFKMKISSVEYIHRHGCFVDRGYMRNVILDKPHALYITDNFLPRVSI